MALTASAPIIDQYIDLGERWIRELVTGDTSYPTGGYPVPPSLFGLNGYMRQKLGGPATKTGVGSGVDAVVPPVVIDMTKNTVAQHAQINFATGNLQLFVVQGATTAEVTNGVNVSTVSVLLEAFGH